MGVTQVQQDAAEVLVSFILRKKRLDIEPYEKSVEDLFYFVLKILAAEYDKNESVEKNCKEFTIFFNYKVGEKRIMVVNLADFKDYIFLDVTSIKEAKKVMEEVADIFNDLQYYKAKYHPYSRDNRGVLSVFLEV